MSDLLLLVLLVTVDTKLLQPPHSLLTDGMDAATLQTNSSCRPLLTPHILTPAFGVEI